ncbi:MAG: hypothetical protein MJY72_07955 [Bacteroidales bacterium]|nr:hypothetical protein [Bacteroidales bacterium]
MGITLLLFSMLLTLCHPKVDIVTDQNDNNDGIDSLLVFYSDIAERGTKYGLGAGYVIVLDHEDHTANDMISLGGVSRLNIYDKEAIDSFARIVFDRPDYDTLTWFPPSVYRFNDEVSVNIPGGYQDGVDCIVAVLAYTKNSVDTISIGDNSRVQLNNLSFDDNDVYKYVLKLVSEKDSTWAKNNEILNYDGQFHHYIEALGHDYPKKQ